MHTHKLKITLALALFLIAASACKVSFTTANISSLKTAKDKEGNSEASTFGPTDTIYAIAIVSNVPDKVTVKWRIMTDQVEGHPSNFSIPNTEASFEMPADGKAYYDISPPTRGWPIGTYKIEISMLNKDGEQKDQKTTIVTVAR